MKLFSLDELRAFYPIILKNYRLPLIIGIAGMIFFIYGLIVLFGSNNQKSQIEFHPAQTIAPENKESIVVDVSGGVVLPGVYKLPTDAIVQDALIKAGGFSSDADRKWIGKNLNLATKLTDGGKIYIPFQGETAEKSNVISSGSTGSLGQVGSTAVLGEAGELININSASDTELDSLPGIGPVTASKIISNRPYGSIDDLVAKKVVTSKVFDKIKDKIRAN